MNGQHGYASVNGLEMYYEVQGAGEPLVLIHGGMSAIGTSFGTLLPYLAKSRQVVAVELQAHGHTADIERPLTMEYLAQDTVGLLDQLGIARADFFGYSIGAGVALQLGIAHPDRVGKLVLMSVTYNRDGFHPGLLDGMEMLQPEQMVGTPFYEEYTRIAPRPQDWPTLVAKVKQLDAEFQGWSAEAVRSVPAPVLVVIGDSDVVRPEHAVERPAPARARPAPARVRPAPARVPLPCAHARRARLRVPADR
jgi:pimeloyl-ACP methyl ester carboxylesterase